MTTKGKVAQPLIRTLAEMIAAAGFRLNRLDLSINEQNYPLEKEGAYDACGLSLFIGDGERSINEVKRAVEPGGGCLEGLVRGLAYLKANPDALKDGPIIFPASSRVGPDGVVSVPYAGMGGDEPRLRLGGIGRGDRWHRLFRFLVSRKSGT